MHTKKCEICGKDFETKNSKLKCCNDICNKKYNANIAVIKRRERLDKEFENSILNEDYVECPYCGLKTKNLSSTHLKMHNKSVSDMKSEFPNQLIFAKKTSEKWSGENSHMKKDEYKKLFSDMVKGEKNPNHTNNTTLIQRKEISPKCIEFYQKRYPEKSNEEHVTMLNEHVKKTNDNIIQTTKLEYWLNKGLSEDDAKNALKDRQTTFTLDKCIEKYGEIEGKERWVNRQEKWITNNKKNNYSKVSQKLFDSIITNLDVKILDILDIYYATFDNPSIDDIYKENKEYTLRLNDRIISPDFFIKNLNLIIEFDGTYYHRENRENTNREIERDTSIKESGYDVLHILESYYKKDSNKEVERCLEFIHNKLGTNYPRKTVKNLF